MGKNYRMIKAQRPRPALTPALDSQNCQPSLVIYTSFSRLPATKANQQLITINQKALMRRTINQAIVNQSTTTANNQLAVLPTSAPKEIGWRGVTALLALATSATIGIYMLRAHFNAPLQSLSPASQLTELANTSFTGTIRPASEFKIAAATPAIVQTLKVAVGDHVTAGQTILTLDNRDAQNAVTQAELEQRTADAQVAELTGSLAILKDRMASLRTEVASANGRVSVAQRRAEQVPVHQRQDSPERAQAIYDQALARNRRAEDLHQRGLISAQEYEEAVSALRIAEVDLKSARAAAQATSELAQAQVDESRLRTELSQHEQQQQLSDLNNQLTRAQLRQQQARSALTAAQQRLADNEVKTTRDGVIIELPVKVGDQIATGSTLAQLAELDRLIVVVPVNARLINTLKVGQAATLKLANNNQQHGQIVTINPIPAENLNHIVEVQFDNRASALLVGQIAEVHFQLH